jgi:RNA polymerase sigma-70 factor, ECF subfamily
MMAEDEGQLIRAAARGDRSAFEELVKCKREQVIRIARQVTGNWDDAVDVSQVVFLKVWQRLSAYDPARPFDTWLYRIAVNAAIDAVRGRGPRAVPHEPADEFEQPTPAAPQIETAIHLGELRRAFQALAARLSPRQRSAFVLREIEGLETAEVARIMDTAESTVRNHLHQARRILKAGLERDYPGLVPRDAK